MTTKETDMQCLQYIFNDTPRPKWVSKCKDVDELREVSIKKYGSIAKAWDANLKRRKFLKLDRNFAPKPGDIIVCDTVNTKEDICKMESDLMLYHATKNGVERVKAEKVYGHYRKK